MATRKQTTKAGATVTTVPANAFTSVPPKGKAKPAKASPLPMPALTDTASMLERAEVAQHNATLPTPVVALRSGPAVQAVALGPKVYRVKAEHNLVAWRAVEALMANGPAPMPAVLDTIKAHPSLGGASGFMQYCLRRGYLVAA